MLVAASPRWITFFSQGVNQSVNGTDKANAIINAHLASGAIGKEGAGPFSITGQPNAMGGREVGGLATQLCAHMGFDPISRAKVSRFWQTNRLAHEPGYKAVDMFEQVASGKIKAIWIMATNPVVSLPRSSKIAEALSECPLVIVSDCVANTDTSRYADVFLPAAGWGEKDGTVTNSERQISRQRSFLPARKEVRPDWTIICDVARKMGFQEAFDFHHPNEIFAEHAALSGFENEGERLFDISHLGSITRDEYDALEPFQWPRHKPFSDQAYPNPPQRANFIPVVDPSLHRGDHEFLLNTGRIRDQWHTMTRTGVDAVLQQHTPEPRVQVHPQDAAGLGIESGDLVEVVNKHGTIRLLAEVHELLAPGQLFIPMHWNEEFAYPCRVNELMGNLTDPISGQPASKSIGVNLFKVQAAQWLRLSSSTPLSRCSDILFQFSVPTPDGWLTELAFGKEYGLAQLLSAFQLKSEFHYCDGMTNAELVLTGRRSTTQGALTLASKRADLLPLPVLSSAEDLHPLSILGGTSAIQDDSPLVCACFEVRRARILDAVAQGHDNIEKLGQSLKCGTNCGSCISEINALLRQGETNPQEIVNG